MSTEKKNRPSDMTPEDHAALDAAGAKYNEAKAAGDEDGMKAAHAAAEETRAKYNYSGGKDGSQKVAIPAQKQAPQQTVSPAPAAPSVNAPSYTAQIPDFTGLLDKWLESAKAQQEGAIDYATNKGVADLERAEEDAQEQFQTQQNQVDIDEAKAKDNQALYAEARGDRGGIGQAQYGQIQATAMQNRRAINSARTKLSTDTARAVADLRAQGEFEKADALLQLTQTYLGQLVELQQWGAEYSLNVAQFNAQLYQWQTEFNMQAQQYNTSNEQWDKEFKYMVSQDERNRLAESGMAALSVGMRPSESQQAAMGYTDAQIDAAIAQYELAQKMALEEHNASIAKKTGGGKTPEAEAKEPNAKTNPYEFLNFHGVADYNTAEALLSQFYDDAYAAGLAEQYMDMVKSGKFDAPNVPTKDEMTVVETAAAKGLGIGPVSYAVVEDLVQQDKVEVTFDSKGGCKVAWKNGYSAEKYKQNGSQSTATAAGKLGTGIIFNDPLNLFSF